MRVVVAGGGGVGGCVGARLAEAGHEVRWLLRGRNLDAVSRRGLTLESPLGDLILGPQRASDDPDVLGPCEFVIVAVKMYDLAALTPRLVPLAGAGAVVLPLQNGVEAREILAEALGPSSILQGTVSVKSWLAEPGRVVCKSPFCRIKLGAPDPAAHAAAAAVAEALDACVGIEARLVEDAERLVWTKFVMLASFSAVACLARATIGEIRESPEAFGLVMEAAEEAARVARARGVDLPDDLDALVRAQVVDMPADGRPSMLEDLEAGRPLEVAWLSGAVVRMARAAGLDAPIHAVAARVLSFRAAGRGPAG